MLSERCHYCWGKFKQSAKLRLKAGNIYLRLRARQDKGGNFW